MAPSDHELAEVELARVGVGAGSSFSGDDHEEDAQPLLQEEGREDVGAAGGEDGGAAGVYPLPNASYSRDGRGWGSKLVFSWIQPVLDKVRSKGQRLSVLATYACCSTAAAVHVHARVRT